MEKIIIIILIIITITGCSDYAELNKLSIVTAVAIDKEKDSYKVTVLIANSPKAQTTSKEGEAKTTIYNGKGKTIAQAVKTIDKKTPKALYFSHVNVVIISDKIGKSGFLNIADWIIRHPQTRNRFYLMQVDDNKAGDVLKIISPLESFPSQSIATLIESSIKDDKTGDTSSYSNFVGRILETGYEPVMPTIKINGNVKKGSKQANLETAQPNTYLSLGPLAIYKGDKLVKTTTRKQTDLIYILNNEAKETIYNLKYKNADTNIFSNNLKTKIELTDINTVDIYIKGNGTIYEVNGNINLDNHKEIEKIETSWNKKLKKDISKLIYDIKTNYKSDIFGIGNMIYKNYPKKWKELKKDWNNKNFKKLNIKVHTNLRIISSGSLTKSLKEGEK